ncbi:hypothetical protein HanXRQr2_Chr11g0508351 [Helianthus annuus]|uniref:Uncharacterized protein n=1 Tax=Helianthus annuus TaxID=4232 RepID=A0A251TDF2_HELAN|nr:hypothetical protein HanXRQr2_Chr11g0508351 [Helianthus annuus]
MLTSVSITLFVGNFMELYILMVVWGELAGSHIHRFLWRKPEEQYMAKRSKDRKVTKNSGQRAH